MQGPSIPVREKAIPLDQCPPTGGDFGGYFSIPNRVGGHTRTDKPMVGMVGWLDVSNRQISCALISGQIFLDCRVYARGAYFLSLSSLSFITCDNRFQMLYLFQTPAAFLQTGPVFHVLHQPCHLLHLEMGFCNAGKLVGKSCLQFCNGRLQFLDSSCEAPTRNYILKIYQDQ